MTLLMTILILTCAVIISLFDKMIEYFSPNGYFAQVSQEVNNVIASLEENEAQIEE